MILGWLRYICILSSRINCSVISSYLNSFFSIILRAHINPLCLYLPIFTRTAQVKLVHIYLNQVPWFSWNLIHKGISFCPSKLTYSILSQSLFFQSYSPTYYSSQFYPKYNLIYAHFILEEITLKLLRLFKLFPHRTLIKTFLRCLKIQRFRRLYWNVGVVFELMRLTHSRRSPGRSVSQKGRLLWRNQRVA